MTKNSTIPSKMVDKHLFRDYYRLMLKSDDEEGRDHFVSQRAECLLRIGTRDDPDDYRFRAGTPNKVGPKTELE